MSAYANSDMLLMERTGTITTQVALEAETIPTIDASGKPPIRPVFLEICEATGDFNVRVDEGTTTGDAVAVVAADLALGNRKLIPIGPNTTIRTSGAIRTVDVRWLYPAEARDGMNAIVPHATHLPIKSFSVSVDAAANLTIPADAVELVIETMAGGGATPGITYGVGASGNPSPILNIAATLVSMGAPTRIFINDGDVLRAQKLGANAQTVNGYWRLKK